MHGVINIIADTLRRRFRHNRLTASDPSHGIDAVGANIHQCAASQIALEPDVVRGHQLPGNFKSRFHLQQLAKFATAHGLFNEQRKRMVAIVEGLHEQAARPPRRREHRCGFRCI